MLDHRKYIWYTSCQIFPSALRKIACRILLYRITSYHDIRLQPLQRKWFYGFSDIDGIIMTASYHITSHHIIISVISASSPTPAPKYSTDAVILLVSHHTIAYDITSHQTTSHRVISTSRHFTSHHIKSRHTTSLMSCRITSCHVTSHHIKSRHTTSLTSCHITSRHVPSRS